MSTSSRSAPDSGVGSSIAVGPSGTAGGARKCARVAAQEGGVEEIAILRDDLDAAPQRSRGERKRAVSAPVAEHGPVRRARHRVEQDAQRARMRRVLRRVVRAGESQDASRRNLQLRLVARIDALVVERETGLAWRY